MSILMMIKVFGDACVCFAILGALPMDFPHSYSLFWPALLCGIGAGVAAFLKNSGKHKLCYLGILFPLFSLRLAEATGEMLILLPMILYTAVMIFRGRLKLEYYGYRQYFRNSLFLVAGVYVAFCMLSYLENGLLGTQTIRVDVTLGYGLVHLVTGILLQRQLRLGAVTQAHGSNAQMVAVLGGTGLVILGFMAEKEQLQKILETVLGAVLTVVSGVALYIYELIFTLADRIELFVMTEQINAARGDSEVPVMGPVLQEMVQRATEEQPESPSHWWVIPVLIALAAAIVLMLRSFSRHDGESASEEVVEKVRLPEQKKTEPRRSNRSKVRHYYREFLRAEQKKGLRLEKSMTTEDILQKISSGTDEAAASQLRQVYLRARYNENSEVTQEQVELAKSALRRSHG